MLAAWSAQCVTGFAAHNDDLIEHGCPSIELAAYVVSGNFWSATFENWESEFLQMGVYVLLTVWLRQKGSAESRPMDEREEDAPFMPEGPHPGPQQRAGVVSWLYGNSLSIAFLALFLASFIGHLFGSWRKSIGDALMHHQSPETLGHYFAGPSFWFESFQNWQSEFLAVLSLVVLSIFLRQKHSPQSKKVDEPNSKTGT
jgi:membrane protein implicated in regulation of membrane protease activity